LRSRRLLWLYGVGTFGVLLLLNLFLLPVALAGSAALYQEMFISVMLLATQILFVTTSIVAFQFSREIFEGEKGFLYQVRNFGQLKATSTVLAVLLFLWIIVLALVLTTLFISASAANLFPAEVINILSVAVLRLGGTTLVAVLLGLFLGRTVGKFAFYSIIIAMVLLLTPAIDFIVGGILGAETGYTVRLVIYWIFLAPFELSTMASIAFVDSVYLIPNELHQWLLPAVWMVALLAGIVASLRWSKKSSVLVAMLIFGLLAIPWAAQGSQIALPRFSAAPHSIDDRSLMPGVFTSDWWQNPPDWDYLYPIPAVTNYKIDLDIRSRLSGRVVMTLEEPFLRTPTFTLFRGYHLSSITNFEGKQLDFSREGNHITILTPGQENTMGFIFEYAGSGWGHYANNQGIFLPGSFPWYPWPGKQRFYWEDPRFNVGIPRHFSRVGDVQGFDIRIKSTHSEIFTPHGIILTQSNELTSIPVEALTLMAGQVQRTGDEDTLFFYSGIRGLSIFEDPSIDSVPDITNRRIRQQVLERTFELREMMGLENPNDLNSTSFVVIPAYPFFNNLYLTPIYLDGYILIDEHMQVDLSLALALQDIVRACEKRDVYETLFLYLRQDYWSFPYMPLAKEMTELIHVKGEEHAIQLVVEYLMDDTIAISGKEFFHSLLEEHQ